MGRRYNGKACRLVTMLSLTITFFVVELVVGHIANSLALIADSFHMLSDVVALFVGFVSIKIAKRGSSRGNTYGWARAEVVGAMVNAVFLVALCFTIFVEAMERLITRESIDDAFLLLYVGGAGLLINLIGLGLFHNQAHGHTHGQMSHSHGARGHSHNVGASKSATTRGVNSSSDSDEYCADDKLTALVDEESTKEAVSENDKEELQNEAENNKVNSQQLNMRGVFLHVLGDALGSVVVMVSAGVTLLVRVMQDHCHATTDKLFIPAENITHSHTHDNITMPCEYVDPEWLQCLDPILSLVLVAIILCTSIPLLKQTSSILMQTVPEHITVHMMETDLVKMKGVISVHEFHVWSLSGNRVIASLHIIMSRLEDYINISNRVKHYFHKNGIHSVTIQPEFLEHHQSKDGRECALECGPDMDCHGDTCCGKKLDTTGKICGPKVTATATTDIIV